MKLDRYTVLHRKDERGVIVESKVFGPDDEIPDGFETVSYSPVHAVRGDDQTPVDEVNQTQWENPMSPSFLVEPLPDDVEDSVEETEVEQPEDPELDEGSVLQARQQAGEELTEAEAVDETEAEAVDETEAEAVDETDAGTPVQAQDVPVPPQGGPGSGADVWAAYAASKGVSVEEDAKRDEIIAACTKAGVPVD